MRELYINNQLCDIDGEFNPTFQFKSFLFAKMQGYEAARTWEVSIPLTSRNRAIIQQSQSADSASTFPYTTHTVSYYSEGYPIVENGRAYMVGTGSGRARFVFVLGETIKALKELAEKKLTELTEASTDYLNWNNSVSLNDMSAGFGWCNFFSFTNQDRTVTGANSNLPYATLHPVVTLNYPMNKIQAFFGLTFIGFGSLLNNFGIPISNVDGITGLAANYSTLSLVKTEYTTGGGDPYTDVIDSVALPLFSTYSVTTGERIIISKVDFSKSEHQIRIYGVLNVTLIDDLIETDLLILLNSTISIGGTGTITNMGTYWKYEFDVSGAITINDYFTINFAGHNIDTIESGSYINVSFPEFAQKSLYHQKFYIIPNLPDITCADFINQCCMLTGLFPYVDPATPSTVNFYSVADLYANKSIAQNWSKYLIKESDYMSEGEDMEHALDGFSQRNTLNYAKDELNQLDTSGLITVSNTNIEYESELFRMFFAAGRRASVTNAIVDYPLYDVSIKDGALIRNKTNQSLPIIGKIENVSSVNYLTFPDELRFSAIKTARYSEYQTLVAQPRILKERFQLTPQLTAAIDVRIPVYLEQYGQYYAILEAQVDGEYNADVTLLEI